jgi:hypothetical protein
MIASTVTSGPTVTIRKFRPSPHSVKALITVKDVRIELFSRNGTIVLCAPSRITVKLSITVTIVSFQLHPETTGRTDLSDTTGTIAKTGGTEITAIRATIRTIARVVSPDTIVVMHSTPTILTGAIIVFIAPIANSVITGSCVRIVTIAPIPTIVTEGSIVVGARFAQMVSFPITTPTPTTHNLDSIVIPDPIVTSLTLDSLGTNALFAPKITTRRFGTIGTVESIPTIRTNGQVGILEAILAELFTGKTLINLSSDSTLTLLTIRRNRINVPKQTRLRSRHNRNSRCLGIGYLSPRSRQTLKIGLVEQNRHNRNPAGCGASLPLELD